jgi:hypothetical protein
VPPSLDHGGEGVTVLAARAPKLESALLAAKTAGYSHVNIDGTLIETDPMPHPGTHRGRGQWWSGKHHHHGGNVRVITAPDGWPLWTSDVRPGREHDTTAVRTHQEVLPLLARIADDLRTLGDLGYEGEADTITVAFKKPKDGELTDAQQQFNKAHNGLRAIGERGNSLLKTTFKALRNVSLCPWRIGDIVAAALVLLHIDHAAQHDYRRQRTVTRNGSLPDRHTQFSRQDLPAVVGVNRAAPDRMGRSVGSVSGIESCQFEAFEQAGLARVCRP